MCSTRATRIPSSASAPSSRRWLMLASWEQSRGRAFTNINVQQSRPSSGSGRHERMGDTMSTEQISIELTNLSKAYRGPKKSTITAVEHLDLKIGSSQVFGLLGANG